MFTTLTLYVHTPTKHTRGQLCDKRTHTYYEFIHSVSEMENGRLAALFREN